MVRTSPWKLSRFAPFDLSIKRLHCRIHIASIECRVGRAKIDDYLLLWFAKTPADGEINNIACCRLTTVLLQKLLKLGFLSRRNLNDLESKLGGFRLEVFDL